MDLFQSGKETAGRLSPLILIAYVPTKLVITFRYVCVLGTICALSENQVDCRSGSGDAFGLN